MLVAAGVLYVGLVWLATPTEPFSWHGRIATAVGGAAAIAAGLWSRGRWPPEDRLPPVGSRPLGSYLWWLGVAVVIIGFQLHMFTNEPRELYPTNSSLVNPLLEPRPARAFAFGSWLALGVYLSRG